MLLTEPTSIVPRSDSDEGPAVLGLQVPRFARDDRIGGREQLLLAGIATALVVWFAWGSPNPLPVVQDEKSYVLQSQIFATGRWTVPTPPLAEFFQEAHVLTVPRVASKFPPGHALLLAIGSALGSTPFVPILLSALTGALLFALVRRATDARVALLTLIVWLGDPINLRFRPTYFSEVTSGLMWLCALGALWRWRETRERRWLLAVAAAIGWGAITRPLTMLSFAVPVGAVVLYDVARESRWRDFAAAFALGCLVLAILPLWSQRTTGDWKVWPVSLYQKQYIPYDHPGFGLDSTPPTMQLAVPQRAVYVGFREEHVKHTVARLPRTIFDRLKAIATGEWPATRLVLVPFVVLGALSMTAPIAFALVCSAALFVGYLSYGHWAPWTLYSFEGLPILAVLAALGLWRASRAATARVSSLAPSARDALAAAGFAVLALQTLVHVKQGRDGHLRLSVLDRYIDETTSKPVGGREHRPGDLDPVSGRPMRDSAILFVRYANRIDPHASIVRNSPDLDHELWWIVHDRGLDENCKLVRLAPNRVPMVFDETKLTIEPYVELINRRCDRSLLDPIPSIPARGDSAARHRHQQQ